MATMTQSGSDVVAFLEEQHEQVKELLERVSASQGMARQNAFDELCRLLDMHEEAEEAVVHPAAKRALDDGHEIVKERLHEESHAKKTLMKLEKLDVDSEEFQSLFDELKNAVLLHAESEENQEFERLRDVLDQSKLVNMRKDVQRVEAKEAAKATEKHQKHIKHAH
jgi:hypothetical protein